MWFIFFCQSIRVIFWFLFFRQRIKVILWFLFFRQRIRVIFWFLFFSQRIKVIFWFLFSRQRIRLKPHYMMKSNLTKQFNIVKHMYLYIECPETYIWAIPDVRTDNWTTFFMFEALKLLHPVKPFKCTLCENFCGNPMNSFWHIYILKSV